MKKYSKIFSMNKEVEPIHIGEVEDIDKGGVENFEHEEIDYAIFVLRAGFLRHKVIVTVRTKLS